MLAPPSRHSINAPLETCRADRLGTTDLEGWILAANIIDLVKPFNWQQAINFRSLQCLSLFAWDDGRWEKYGRDSYDEEMNQRSFNRSIGRNMHVDAIAKTVGVQDIGSSSPGERVAPTVSIARILEPVLVRARSTFACGHVSTINDLRYIKGRKVEHQTHFPQQCHFGDRPSRLYSTTKAFDPSVTTYGFDIGGLNFCYDGHRKPVFSIPSGPVDIGRARNIGTWEPATPDLELCIVPEIAGDERQLQLARDIKEALEAFRQKDETTKEYAEIYLTKFKILVGDEVPPCPCCGLSR